MANRESLINGLAQEFNKSKGIQDGLALDTSNYIADTGSLNCTAASITAETLQKTLNVISWHEKKFSKDALTNKQAEQIMLHLKVARKCIEEVLSQK
jgi:hypothetical protein